MISVSVKDFVQDLNAIEFTELLIVAQVILRCFLQTSKRELWSFLVGSIFHKAELSILAVGNFEF